MGSISSKVQNDLEGSLKIYKKGRDLQTGIFVNFHQKLIIYWITLGFYSFWTLTVCS